MAQDKTKLNEAIRALKREINALNLSPPLTVDGELGPVFGPKSVKALNRALQAAPTPEVPAGNFTHLHPYDWIVNEKNTLNPKEKPGSKDNEPRIQWYLEHCDNIGGFKDKKLHADEIPWCSALPNAAADACGCVKTNNALASSWDKYPGKSYKKGDKIPKGAIVRIAHPGGHVTLADKAFTWNDSGTFDGLGGNQGNQIKVSSYSKKHIVSVHDFKPLPGTVLAPITGVVGGKVADGNKESTR